MKNFSTLSKCAAILINRFNIISLYFYLLMKHLKIQMTKILFLSWFILIAPHLAFAAEPTPNDVYAKASQICQEIELIKNHLGFHQKTEEIPVSTQLTPGHSWQKGYEILYKINIFRTHYGLPYTSVPSRAPQLTVTPMIMFEQATRINMELQLLKYYLNITGTITPNPQPFEGKKPTDVYRILNKVSHDLDIINGKSLTPADALTQAVRIFEDINAILDELKINDNVIPPPKNLNAQPGGSFENVIKLLEEISRIKKMIGMDMIDFYTLIPKDRSATPSDVFSVAGIALAELQPIKAYLGLKHILTPMAEYYENIRPAEVQQLFGWSIRKLQLIQHFNRNNS